MNTAANLRAGGYNEANRDYVDTLFNLERRMRHPLATMREGSSDEELSEDEQGPYRLSVKEARKRHYAIKQKEQLTTPQETTPGQQGSVAASHRTQGIAPTSAPTPMEGVEELGALPTSKAPAADPTKKKSDSSVARGASVQPISTRAPPLLPPSPPPIASSSRVDPRPRTLLVPRPPPHPQSVQTSSAVLPAANTSSAARSSPSKRLAPSDSDSDLEIIECSSPLEKRAVASSPPTAKKTSPSTKKPAAPSHKKSRRKILSITQTWEQDKKMGAKAIQDKWQTLATYIDRLREATEASPPKSSALANFRILVVHPDITNGQSSPNRIDAYLVERLGKLAELGAHLVKPADFVARSPSNAGDGEWTTHVLVPEIVPRLRIPFAHILACIGADPRGITVDQLGKETHVVKEQWAWKYRNAVRRGEELPDTEDFGFKDDPRRKLEKSSPTKKVKASKGKGKGREKEDAYETTDDEGGEAKEVENASIS